MNQKAIEAVTDFLTAEGIDLKAAGMDKTPERVVAMYEYMFSGVGRSTDDMWGELIKADSDGMVAVKDIPFYSMCEHHLVPFFGRVSIVYKPKGGIIAGFSKFSQVVEIISHRPQLQERMTEEIAQAVEQGLNTEGVLVIVEAQQLCMNMRKDKANGTKTITTACRGCLKQDNHSYNQAWNMLGWNSIE